MKIRVYYEDTDLGGIVYHSKYLNFCERARSNLFFKEGGSPVFKDYHFVVKRIEADFISPAKFGDVIIVKTEILESKKASFTLKQMIFKEGNEKEIFSMKVLIVCMKGEKVSKIPDHFLKTLKI